MNIEECKAAKAAWLAAACLEEDLRVELEKAVTDEEIEDRFYRELEFGTSGLRGVMGAGTNRMNIHVIDRATQGLAKYMKDIFEDPSCAIAYDTRNNSLRFAQETAKVMLGNGGASFLDGKQGVKVMFPGYALVLGVSWDDIESAE